LGEKTVETAKSNGLWDMQKRDSINDEQLIDFAKKLVGISPAYENFLQMSRSVQRTYTSRYFSFKREDTRHRDFEKIIGRLNKNLKPM